MFFSPRPSVKTSTAVDEFFAFVANPDATDHFFTLNSTAFAKQQSCAVLAIMLESNHVVQSTKMLFITIPENQLSGLEGKINFYQSCSIFAIML